jgi:hypothetical protein
MNSLKKYSTVLIIILICLLMIGVGGLAGWVLVLHTEGKTISFQSAMRGFGLVVPSAGQNGSNYDSSNGAGTGAGGTFSDGSGGSENGAGGTTGGATGNVSGTDYANTGLGQNGVGSTGTNGAGASGSASSSMSLTYGSSTSPEVVIPKTPRLWRVNKTPTAGFSFATSSPELYYAERATGYIFTADAISGSVLRRTNTLFPKTYEAFLGHDGSALYRSLNDTTGSIQTFSGIMGSSTSNNLGSLIGVNLPNNILAISANPDAKSIFYLSQQDDGSFAGFTAPWIPGKSAKAKQIFTSLIRSWRPIFLSDGRTMIVESANDNAIGYSYEILSSGTMKPLAHNILGLTFLPLSNSDAYLYGSSANGTLALFMQTSTTTYALPVKTIADKCTWAPYTTATKKKPASHMVVYCAVPESIGVKNFLQAWYMGALHTSDSWWQMDFTTGQTEKILDANTGGSQLDVIDPSIDPTGNFLGFRNNLDGSLWLLRINK